MGTTTKCVVVYCLLCTLINMAILSVVKFPVGMFKKEVHLCSTNLMGNVILSGICINTNAIFFKEENWIGISENTKFEGVRGCNGEGAPIDFVT